MSQASHEAALQRIEAGLDRLSRAIQKLPEKVLTADADKWVSRDSHEALKAAHELLRSRASAAVAGIDRLLGDKKEG